MINLVDSFSTNNNCGFNLTNFKPKFIRDYFDEVVQDYERSFVGAFSSSLFSLLEEKNNGQYEVYFTIAKFINHVGYSLT